MCPSHLPEKPMGHLVSQLGTGAWEKSGKAGRDGVGQPWDGQGSLSGCRTDVAFLTYQLSSLQKRHPGLKGPQTILCTQRNGKQCPWAGEMGILLERKIIPLCQRVLQAGLFAARTDFSCGQWDCLTLSAQRSTKKSTGSAAELPPLPRPGSQEFCREEAWNPAVRMHRHCSFWRTG